MAGLKGLFNGLCGIFNGSHGLNRRNLMGETKLYAACRTGNLSRVRGLLRRGANPDIPNRRGLTPLHIAAYWGEPKIVALLLQHKADPNAHNGRGWTPLHSAALGGGQARQRSINLLLKAGARTDIVDKNGWTAMQYMKLWQDGDDAQNAEAKRLLQTILYNQHLSHQPPVCDTTGKPCTPDCIKRGPRAPRH